MLPLPKPAPLEPIDIDWAPDEWEVRRVELWEEWARLIKLAPADDLPRHRDWQEPPFGAADNDGIGGLVFRFRWSSLRIRPDREYARTQVGYALGEVEQFRREKPEAAKSIRGPLRTYTNLLRSILAEYG